MAGFGKKIRLGEALVLTNSITEAQLEEALAKQKSTGKRLGEVLIDDGLVSDVVIAKVLHAQLGYPIVELQGIDIPPEVKGLVSSSVLKKYKILPIEYAETI